MWTVVLQSGSFHSLTDVVFNKTYNSPDFSEHIF